MKGLILNSETIQLPDQGSPNPITLSNTSQPENTKNTEIVVNQEQDKIHFYGILENGQSFIWEIKKTTYQLTFCRSEFIPPNFSGKKISEKFVDFRRNPLTGYYFSGRHSMLRWTEQVDPKSEIEFQEIGLTAPSRFLIDQGIKRLISFESEPTKRINAQTVFYQDPEFKIIHSVRRNAPNNFSRLEKLFDEENPFFPTKVISLDIETGMKDDILYSIALYGKNYQKVLMLSNERKTENITEYFTSEKELLLFFLKEIEEINPHILIGWYVVNFDFNYLVKKFKQHDLNFNLGIGNLPVAAFKTGKSKEMIVKIPGRVIIEGIDTVKWLYPKLPNYRLNTAGEVILGEKKIIEATQHEKVKEIDRLFQEDKPSLAAYNLQDCKLVYNLFKKLEGISFNMIRSLLSGCDVEKIDIPNEILDHYYLSILHQKNIASYNPPKSRIKPTDDNSIHEFKKGVYKNVFLISFQDLYPFIILSYRIDPLGLIRAQLDRDQATFTARGFSFHQKEHILPQIIYDLARLINYQEAKILFQRDNLEIHSETMPKETPKETPKAIKIWETEISQIITAITSSQSRFFFPGLAEAIRENVQFVIEAIARKIETLSEMKVIYLDNEIIAIQCQKIDDSPVHTKTQLTTLLNEDFFSQVLPSGKNDHKIFPSIKSIKFFPQFFLESETSSMKPKSTIEFKALNTQGEFQNQISTQEKRLPQTTVFLNELIETILRGQSGEDYLKSFRKLLIEGEFDNNLVYQKRLSKEINEYTSNLPPQVIAAKKIADKLEKRKQQGLSTRWIRYYQTTDGPEPIEKKEHEIDYQYYLDKEFAPALEKLFQNTSLQFLIDIFKSEDFQLSLF